MTEHASLIERQNDITQAIADEICERIADGESLRKICEDSHIPKRGTLFRLMALPAYKAFADQYARAREASADADADDIGHIARQAAEGEVEPAAARAAIDGLKWSAGKRKPKKYGDKVALVGGGSDDEPIRHQLDPSNLTDEQLVALAGILGAPAVSGAGAGGDIEAEG